MIKQYFRQAFKRGAVSLVRRQVFVWMMVVMPLLCAFFFFDLMHKGPVTRVPVGVVDLDNSSTSRALSRNLGAMQNVEIKCHFANFQEACDAVQRGDVLGFILMPAHLEERALSGNHPTISYYVSYAYYTPASMMYKGFKTITVLANGAIATVALRTLGMRSEAISATLQPVATQVHPINNPWVNYSYYLNSSFVPALLALLILLVTAFSIGTEFKYGTCRQWLRSSGDSITIALTGKLLPQTCIWCAIGWFIQFMMYRIYQFPLNCHPSDHDSGHGALCAGQSGMGHHGHVRDPKLSLRQHTVHVAGHAHLLVLRFLAAGRVDVQLGRGPGLCDASQVLLPAQLRRGTQRVAIVLHAL
jgi:hypothetical protein